ncbi:hypothetical protein ACINNAV21_1036 [Acinetobacter baumannii Naval-21]|nr:hypothetical protein ACIN5074_1097 [Acinetobacter baumannii OIFC074]EKP54924.1 hypothetical protein ACINNAV21_1036 [Acinetobacter baumannii Naval-21]KLT82296.1 hypothetical protein T632_2766 [Acinetobacter baumannii MRSN 4106]KLT88895.1 hypothetical protein T629_2909 [Acinetobacter baumannii MRSN 3405]KLU00157.1 hypothetical protein T631_2839 [Acinetobacter baumannii MRSN 3942]CQR68715.1 fragment of Orfc273-4 from Vibrio metschnikovii [Acinetobacter baumannii]
MFYSLLGEFLNGVCRHELIPYALEKISAFLNGVCRHEHFGHL